MTVGCLRTWFFPQRERGECENASAGGRPKKPHLPSHASNKSYALMKKTAAELKTRFAKMRTSVISKSKKKRAFARFFYERRFHQSRKDRYPINSAGGEAVAAPPSHREEWTRFLGQC